MIKVELDRGYCGREMPDDLQIGTKRSPHFVWTPSISAGGTRPCPSCGGRECLHSYRSGIDVVVEGAIERVTDNDMLVRLARLWSDKIDWVFEVGEGVFLNTEAAGQAALVFAVTPSKILAFRKAPYSQTRYRM